MRKRLSLPGSRGCLLFLGLLSLQQLLAQQTFPVNGVAEPKPAVMFLVMPQLLRTARLHLQMQHWLYVTEKLLPLETM